MKQGRPRQFPLDYEEAYQKIEDYKVRTARNEIDMPSIPDFLAEIGSCPDEWFNVINDPSDKNIRLAELLKKFGNWADAQVMKWGRGPKLSLAIFILKQGFGGYKYTDRQDVKQSGDIKVTVDFGGKCDDPFG